MELRLKLISFDACEIPKSEFQGELVDQVRRSGVPMAAPLISKALDEGRFAGFTFRKKFIELCGKIDPQILLKAIRKSTFDNWNSRSIPRMKVVEGIEKLLILEELNPDLPGMEEALKEARERCSYGLTCDLVLDVDMDVAERVFRVLDNAGCLNSLLTERYEKMAEVVEIAKGLGYLGKLFEAAKKRSDVMKKVLPDRLSTDLIHLSRIKNIRIFMDYFIRNDDMENLRILFLATAETEKIANLLKENDYKKYLRQGVEWCWDVGEKKYLLIRIAESLCEEDKVNYLFGAQVDPAHLVRMINGLLSIEHISSFFKFVRSAIENGAFPGIVKEMLNSDGKEIVELTVWDFGPDLIRTADQENLLLELLEAVDRHDKLRLLVSRAEQGGASDLLIKVISEHPDNPVVAKLLGEISL